MTLRGTALILIVLPFILVAAARDNTPKETRKPAGDCPEYDAVDYIKPADYLLQRMKVTKLSPAAKELTAVSKLPKQQSPYATKWFVILQSDFMRPGPWDTTVYVFGNQVQPVRLKLQFQDHGNGGVGAEWLNEKLLFLTVWWGRIVSTEMILDVETAKFIYIEEANYGSMILLPCEEKQKLKRK